MSFPVFDDCCKKFDTTSGIFIECVCGKLVKPRVGHEFTLRILNDHNNDPNHWDKIALLRKRAKGIE